MRTRVAVLGGGVAGLDATGSRAPRCGVWELHEPDLLAPLKAMDRHRFEKGQPNAHDRQ
jgi:hypothetical protein